VLRDLRLQLPSKDSDVISCSLVLPSRGAPHLSLPELALGLVRALPSLVSHPGVGVLSAAWLIPALRGSEPWAHGLGPELPQRASERVSGERGLTISEHQLGRLREYPRERERERERERTA
jgi:hypothetical protein